MDIRVRLMHSSARSNPQIISLRRTAKEVRSWGTLRYRKSRFLKLIGRTLSIRACSRAPAFQLDSSPSRMETATLFHENGQLHNFDCLKRLKPVETVCRRVARACHTMDSDNSSSNDALEQTCGTAACVSGDNWAEGCIILPTVVDDLFLH